MSVKITDNTPIRLAELQRGISLALRFAIDDIDRFAFPKTPKNRGELRKNIIKQVVGTRASIRWGSHYAIYQENPRRSFRYTTPGTGPHFAENAAKRVGKNANFYVKKAKLI